jgi:capsular polysaccharide biosynthesis protein
MASSEPGRGTPDEPRWVAAVEPRFPPGNGQRLTPVPLERVVYGEPSTIHDAFSRYWLVILLVGIIGAAAGVAQAVSKPPVYAASAQLGVGLTNVGTPGGLGGFAQSGPTLAAAYSRAAVAQPVVASVAKKVGMSTQDVRGTVSASSVPATPVIRVDAVSQSEEGAIALANAMSDALARYAGDTAPSVRQGDALLRDYRAAERELETIRGRVTRAEQAVSDGGGAEASSALRSARADASAASLQVKTLAARYESAQQNIAGADPVEVLEHAASATSNARSQITRTGFLGGAVGLVVGTALALLLANRRRRRALR